MNKKILVTGANKGIGLEITKQLTAMGHTVIMTGRSLSKLTEAKNSLPLDAKTDFYEMDVSSGKSILDAYEKIKDVYPYLDVIINNAGILIDEDKSLFDSTEDDFLKTIQTNSIGPFLVIKSFSNLLKKGGTIINISSGGGQITHGVSTWSPLYCLSKTLLNAITLQFAKALESKEITVNAVCPGWVKTDMGGQSASRSVEKGAETPVWLATSKVSFTGKFLRDKKEIDW